MLSSMLQYLLIGKLGFWLVSIPFRTQLYFKTHENIIKSTERNTKNEEQVKSKGESSVMVMTHLMTAAADYGCHCNT